MRTHRRGSNPRSAARRGGHSPESRRGPNRSLGFSDVDGEDLIYTSSDEDERLEMQHSRAAENPEDLATAEEFWSSLVILSFMVLIYLWGAVELCRKHIWLEALFTIVLPVFAMTTGWQEYTVTATAPTSPPNPVYSSRLHFEAAPGDTVDIDQVYFVPEPAQWMQIASGVALLAGLNARRNRHPCSRSGPSRSLR